MQIGLISDTHGLLRTEALRALEGADHILHAGDVGDIAILEQLRQIAPVTAIRGNIDRFGDLALVPATELVELGGRSFYLLHNLQELDLKPEAAGISVVLSGHSHRPEMFHQNGVLYCNPGSAGPRRFSLPITVGRIRLQPDLLEAEIIELTTMASL